MLTDKAYADRYWKAFPELRRVLEGRRPTSETWRTSVEGTSFEHVERLLSIAAVATEGRDSLLALVAQGSAQRAGRELEELAGELAELGRWIERQSEKVMHLRAELERVANQG